MSVRYRKKDDRVFEATQWHKHGDHQAVGELNYDPTTCEECGAPFLLHGWFGRTTPKVGHYVHPGDWVLECNGETWVVSGNRFEYEFEEVE